MAKPRQDRPDRIEDRDTNGRTKIQRQIKFKNADPDKIDHGAPQDQAQRALGQTVGLRTSDVFPRDARIKITAFRLGHKERPLGQTLENGYYKKLRRV